MQLSTRLSAFFLTALAMVLAAFSIALFVLAQRYLHHQVDARLISALEVLAAAAEIHPEGVEWEASERELRLGQESGPNRLLWIVFTDGGYRVDQSKNLDDTLLTPEWERLTDSVQLPDRLRDRSGEVWKVAQHRLGSGDGVGKGSNHRYLFLTVAGPLSPVYHTLSVLALVLTVVSLTIWIIAALVGRWLIRQALAPLTRMVQSAQGLDATDSGWSLPLSGTDDELDELGHAFNDLLGRLRVAFERQRRFAGDASHQLRTPLTALIGQVEVALRRERSSEEYQRVLGLLRGQASGLAQIVEALLFLGRADSEAGLPDSVPLDLESWMNDHIHINANANQIEVSTSGPAWVRGHPPLLGQLLDNLLDNACKYGHAGDPVVVSLQSDLTTVTLTVEDRGIGIEPVDLPRIFEPFFRSSQARKLGRPGVGLGLSVAQRIVAALGGSIHVESTVGRGSRFIVRLPSIAGPPDAQITRANSALAKIQY